MTTSPRVKNPVDANGLSQCFHKVSTTIYVSLAPVYTQNPTAGIKSQHLDPLLMTYFPSVDGVVLSYSNLRLLGKDEDLSVQPGEAVMAKVMYDSPFSYLWIAVDFLVWRPQAGDKVEGWVNLQSPSHIGLLIHDTFNASIKRDAIPSDWYFEPLQADEEAEYDENAELTNTVDAAAAELEKTEQAAASDAKKQFKGPKVLGHWFDAKGTRVEGKLKLTVRSVNVNGKFITVQGTLVDLEALPVDYKSRKIITPTGAGSSASSNSTTKNAAAGKHMKFDESDSESAQESPKVASNGDAAAVAGSGEVAYADADSDDSDDSD
ncbi:hypothetical protein D0Z00_002767 [Geotrichum galactomycetum]|uniref:Uncharacterized protein n=1 Tax=Geotrichum galactomycetum TaxID=27317 RepID=A0ACB6V367_9ASCO|nr:hypothetical protein D0Z00_002767 [Geotrichum candidum]